MIATALLACAAIASPAFAQTVLVVDDDPGTPGAFTTIQAAVDAAQAGDTVAVRAGFYGEVALGTKTLTLVGIPASDGARPQLSGIQIVGTGISDRVVLRTLDLVGSAGLRITAASGPVFVEDVTAEFGFIIDQSAGVTVVRGDFEGGVQVEESVLDLFDTDIRGNNPGGTGLRAIQSPVFATGGTILGGNGAKGPDASFFIPFCGPGGPGGVGISSSGADIVLQDVLYFGGSGGPGGAPGPVALPCDSGPPGPAFIGSPPLVELPSTGPGHRSLEAVGTTQIPDPVVIVANGAEGEDLLLYASVGLDSLFLPTWFGSLVVDPAQGFFFPAATIPAGGSIELSFPVVLPPLLDSLQLAIQGLFVNPSGLGPNYVGDPTWVQVISDGIPLVDCDLNGISDAEQILSGTGSDCDQSGVLDGCEIALDLVADCNGNGVPDTCDLASGTSLDLNGDNVPDECGQALYVPSDYPTVEAAIQAANSGDTIILADGVYSGAGNAAIQVETKYFTIQSANGPANCTVDLAGAHRFLFTVRAQATVLVKGITFVDGSEFDPLLNVGSPIRARDTNLVVENCVFVGGRADRGGAVRFEVVDEVLYSLVVEDTVFEDCRASFDGGAVFATAFDNLIGQPQPVNTAITLERCRFVSNRAGNAAGQWGCGGAVTIAGSLGPAKGRLDTTIRNCLFVDNRSEGAAGAIELTKATLDLTGCTFEGNLALGPDFGGGTLRATASSVAITNSIFSGGAAAGVGQELWFADSVTAPTGAFVEYSLVEGGASVVAAAPGAPALGASVIDADPLFFSPLDQHLLPGSPAIDAGDPGFVPAPGETDLDGAPRLQGSAVDLGCYETSP